MKGGQDEVKERERVKDYKIGMAKLINAHVLYAHIVYYCVAGKLNFTRSQ